jgi:hypothetical protein
VYIFHVKYIDYDKDSIPLGNAFNPLIHKPIFYDNEKELRALLLFFPDNENIIKYKQKNGINVNVDLDILLEEIWLHPKASWHRELIESILKKYGLTKKVNISKLGDKPKTL